MSKKGATKDIKHSAAVNFDYADMFRHIVNEGSLAKAAERLGVTASVASKRLAKLEQQLGVQLLTRTTRRQFLTEEGEVFYQRVHSIYQDWQNSVDEVRCLKEEPQGVLTIATPQPLASRFLMPMLAEFQRRYPKIHLQLMHRSLDGLPCINADISICRQLEKYESASVVATPFYSYQNQLFAAPAYLSSHKIQSTDDISTCDGLFYGEVSVANRFYADLGKVGLNNQGDCETRDSDRSDNRHVWHLNGESISANKGLLTNNTEILVHAAIQGMGIICVPKVMVEQELRLGLLQCVLPEVASAQHMTMAYYSKMSFTSAKISVFLLFLKEFYAEFA